MSLPVCRAVGTCLITSIVLQEVQGSLWASFTVKDAIFVVFGQVLSFFV
jgi:hypothetical protein